MKKKAKHSKKRARTTNKDENIRDRIQQVLFTNPGERVEQPDFGCGLLCLVFEPNNAVLIATTQTIVKDALQRWLNDLIRVENVHVKSDEDRLEVTIIYIKRDSSERRVDQFSFSLDERAK